MNVERWARQCEFSGCSRRRRLWRAWLDPVEGYTFEGHWYCSLECFQQALMFAIRKSLPGSVRAPVMAHRVPLGLLLLSRGMVNDDQLKRALKAQKESGSGRVGEWLRHIGAVSEEQVTQALGLQWSIPVFPLSQSRRFLECAHLIPYPLLKEAAMVPVHHLPTSQHLYVAFIDRVNYSALYALEKMLNCRTEPCLAVQSQVCKALEELRAKPRPTEVLVAAICDPESMASTIVAHSDRLGSTDVKLSGFDGFIWARIEHAAGYTDLLFQPERDQHELISLAELRG